MTPQDAFANLRTVLARLYPDAELARVIVRGAALNAQRISFSGTAVTTWNSILTQAENEYKMDDLLNIALQEFPSSPPLRQAIEDFRNSTPLSVQHLPEAGGNPHGSTTAESTLTSPAPNTPQPAGVDPQQPATTRTSTIPTWFPVAGVLCGVLTLLFFMGLVTASLFGYEVPCDTRFSVVVVLALGAALATSFLGGMAAAEGRLPFPSALANPLQFSVGGGIAVLLIFLVLGYWLYLSPSCAQDGPPGTNTTPPSASAAHPYLSASFIVTSTHPIDDAVYVYVPAGEFLAGDPGEQTPIDAFWIMQQEVTNELYRKCTECNQEGISRLFDPQFLQHPVNVSWEQTNQYAAWVGGRLPTEEEWEKACRGGLYLDGREGTTIENPNRDRRYPWEDDREPNAMLANYSHSSGSGDTRDADEFPSPGDSPYGIADMAGNVWEFTASLDSDNAHVLRGGSYQNSRDAIGCGARESVLRADDGTPRRRLGFRLVNDMEAPE